MEDWIAYKAALLAWSGLDRGAIHVLVSVPALLLLAAILRRPLSSPLPWLALLLVEIANEAASGYADGRLEDWELAGSIRDVPLVMALPTVLLLVARFAPSLLHRPPRSEPVALSAEDVAPDPIIDAEYEEVR